MFPVQPGGMEAMQGGCDVEDSVVNVVTTAVTIAMHNELIMLAVQAYWRAHPTLIVQCRPMPAACVTFW